MIQRAALIFVVAAILGLSTTHASAYTVLKTGSGATKYWQSGEASWTLSPAGMPGVDNDTLQQALNAAFVSWEEVTCSTISFTWDQFTNNDSNTGIHITINSTFVEPSVADALAYTVTDNKNNGKGN